MAFDKNIFLTYTLSRYSINKKGGIMSDLLKDADTSGKIKALLASKDIPLENLAQILDVTPMTIYNRFKSDDWHIKDLRKIAEAYGVDIHDLI